MSINQIAISVVTLTSVPDGLDAWNNRKSVGWKGHAYTVLTCLYFTPVIGATIGLIKQLILLAQRIVKYIGNCFSSKTSVSKKESSESDNKTLAKPSQEPSKAQNQELNAEEKPSDQKTASSSSNVDLDKVSPPEFKEAATALPINGEPDPVAGAQTEGAKNPTKPPITVQTDEGDEDGGLADGEDISVLTSEQSSEQSSGQNSTEVKDEASKSSTVNQPPAKELAEKAEGQAAPIAASVPTQKEGPKAKPVIEIETKAKVEAQTNPVPAGKPPQTGEQAGEVSEQPTALNFQGERSVTVLLSPRARKSFDALKALYSPVTSPITSPVTSPITSPRGSPTNATRTLNTTQIVGSAAVDQEKLKKDSEAAKKLDSLKTKTLDSEAAKKSDSLKTMTLDSEAARKSDSLTQKTFSKEFKSALDKKLKAFKLTRKAIFAESGGFVLKKKDVTVAGKIIKSWTSHVPAPGELIGTDTASVEKIIPHLLQYIERSGNMPGVLEKDRPDLEVAFYAYLTALLKVLPRDRTRWKELKVPDPRFLMHWFAERIVNPPSITAPAQATTAAFSANKKMAQATSPRSSVASSGAQNTSSTPSSSAQKPQVPNPSPSPKAPPAAATVPFYSTANIPSSAPFTQKLLSQRAAQTLPQSPNPASGQPQAATKGSPPFAAAVAPSPSNTSGQPQDVTRSSPPSAPAVAQSPANQPKAKS